MRTLINRYAGNCRKCGAELPEGSQVVYERKIGIFCPSCAPADSSEELRTYRQEARDSKAARYEEWAAKRREKAAAVFKADSWAHGNTAFNTQPGRIPERERMIARHERQYESLDKAESMEAKAEALRRPVAVKGDAERRREALTAKVLEWIKVGSKVTGPFIRGAFGTVVKVSKKTAIVKDEYWKEDPNYNGCKENLYWLSPYQETK